MEHSNIIISVIVVLCIAAGVTAYGLTNPDNVFSDLAGFTPSTDTIAPVSDSGSENGIPSSDNSGTNDNSNSNNQNTNDASQSNSGSHQSNNGNVKTTTQNNGKNTGTNSGNGNNNGNTNSNSGSNGNGNNNGNTNSNSGSNGNGHGGSNQTVIVTNITEKDAIDIADQHVEEEGAYAAKAVWENSTWYVYIHDAKGETVDSIMLDWNGTVIGRG